MAAQEKREGGRPPGFLVIQRREEVVGYGVRVTGKVLWRLWGGRLKGWCGWFEAGLLLGHHDFFVGGLYGDSQTDLGGVLQLGVSL
jgi:hypothetical protein